MNPFEIVSAWPKEEGYFVLGQVVRQGSRFFVDSWIACRDDDGSFVKMLTLVDLLPGPFLTEALARKGTIELAAVVDYEIVWTNE